MLSRVFAAALAAALANSSVLDVGAGLGQYGAYLQEHAPSVQWTGVDGAENIEQVTHGRVAFADTTDGLRPAQRRAYDFVMSIELAEHVPREGEAALMHTLTAHVRRSIILSWAELGRDDGWHHTNCQSSQYTECAMGLVGFRRDNDLQQRLRASLELGNSLPWLRGSLSTWTRSGKQQGDDEAEDASVSELRRWLQVPVPTREFVARYNSLTLRRCAHAYTIGGCNSTRFPRVRAAVNRTQQRKSKSSKRRSDARRRKQQQEQEGYLPWQALLLATCLVNLGCCTLSFFEAPDGDAEDGQTRAESAEGRERCGNKA